MDAKARKSGFGTILAEGLDRCGMKRVQSSTIIQERQQDRGTNVVFEQYSFEIKKLRRYKILQVRIIVLLRFAAYMKIEIAIDS